MASTFVPVTELRSSAEMKADPFFARVAERAKTTLHYPGQWRRLQDPACQKCQFDFKAKYPGLPFEPNCDGIYGEADFPRVANLSELTLEEAREFIDVQYWAEHVIVLKNKDGDYFPYSTEKHPYQIPVLKCTAQYQVDRMGRGMGKTTIAVITELHRCITRKNYEVLVLCPAKAQAQLWYEEITTQLENSPRLRGSLKESKQSPYFIFRFRNGSKIKIFTAGSKSGRGAIAIRGQSPKRVRLDEQDFLEEADYDAVTALLRRFPESEFHGSSTPTGARSMYWQMCCAMPEYREFYIPVTEKPGWNKEMEMTLRRDAKTADRYNHEYMALFGDLEAGVFKGITVDAAKKQYAYATAEYSADGLKLIGMTWNDCPYSRARNYILGCDWNGNGTGTRIRIIEFDPLTKKRRCVYKDTIDQEGATTKTSLIRIRDLNRMFHLDHIYCDKGFGFAQDELLREMGKTPPVEFAHEDVRLMRANFIGSRETLKTNRLVPKRNPNSPKIEDKELERNTKPFMVEGCQIALENSYVEFSADDERLEMQMRDYRVKTWSANGQAASYEAKTEGDHDLDAWVLAMLGIELNYGLFFDPNAQNHLVELCFASGFGVEGGLEAKIEAARANLCAKGIPSRTGPKKTEDEWKVIFAQRGGAMVAPAGAGRTSAVGPGSRTAMFRNAGTGSRTQGVHSPRSRSF